MTRHRLHEVSNIQNLTSPIVEHYRSQLGTDSTSVLDFPNLRGRALNLLRQTLPIGKVENWKYTDLRKYFRSPFQLVCRPSPVSKEKIKPFMIADSPCVVFLDGFFFPELSVVEGLSISPVDEKVVGIVANMERPGLTALNTAVMTDGVSINVNGGKCTNIPIQILYFTTDDFEGECHTRIVLTVENECDAFLFERHISLGRAKGLINNVIEFSVGADASLQHIVLQQAGTDLHHISSRFGCLSRNAKVRGFQMVTGSALSRAETVVSLACEGGRAKFSGIALMRDRQHCDFTTDISHDAPNCHSSQVFKNVVAERARSVFQGRVYVARDAQSTEANQLNRNLLLSRQARADAKPELIIHADDVKCSHGATVGDLDEEALFYLKSRGIPANEARSLLIKGFASELFEEIANPALASLMEETLKKWLIKGWKERVAA